MAPFHLRDVSPDDAEAIAAIYAPVVEQTHTSFEEVPPDAEEFRRRIGRVTPRYPWVVAEDDQAVCGYAYCGRFRERPAYRYSAEVTVYVATQLHRMGVGRMLYTALFERLRDLGYRRAFAGIALPNDGSVGLHRSLGFEPVGVFRQAGFKFGRWIDVSWWQREC